MIKPISFLVLLSFTAHSADLNPIKKNVCAQSIFEAAGIQVPEIHILVEGAGDVVERFYLPALQGITQSRAGQRKLHVTFADYSAADQPLEQREKTERIRQRIETAGFHYLNKAVPGELAVYKAAAPDYVFLATPPRTQTRLVSQWQERGIPPIRIFAEKPLEGSVSAARALAERLGLGNDSVLALDHYRPKLNLKPEDIRRIETYLGGLRSFETYITENRSGSDKEAAVYGNGDHDGAIENEGRAAVLQEGIATDLAPHALALLEYFTNTRTLKAKTTRAGRYMGVDGDPEKPASIPNETFFASEVIVQDNHGHPVTGKIVLGKGVRVRKYGPELEDNTKIFELVGNNGRRVVFDLRRKGDRASTATYYEADGSIHRTSLLEPLPYEAIVAGVVDGRSHTNGLAFSVHDGATFREKLAELVSPARGSDLPLYPGGMGGMNERPAPYVEDLWNTLPALPDRDFLMIGGTGVMGKGFSHRIAQIAGLNLVIADPSKDAADVVKTLGPNADVLLAPDLQSAVQSLKRPRKMMLLVSNDRVTESILTKLKGMLDPGDVIIDGGNNLWTNTERRQKALAEKGIHLIGMGVSGGERGAWNGSSMMPGGSPEGYELVRPILETIAARIPSISDPSIQTPSVSYIGPGGAGHFVKMTHNGIEYVEMQLLSEVYDLLKKGAGLENEDLASLFSQWNNTELKSFLLGATARVVNYPDKKTGEPLVERIKAVAKQKGTGKWTTDNALELGAFTPTLSEAVFARNATAYGSLFANCQTLSGPDGCLEGDKRAQLLEALPRALYAARLLDFAQGFHLIDLANQEKFEGKIQLSGLANTWRTGSILQGYMLNEITREFVENPSYRTPLDSAHLRKTLSKYQQALRDVVQAGHSLGIPLPAFSSLLNYYDTLRARSLPANLIQAMRDYFGGHTFQRIDEPGDFHEDWGDSSDQRQ